MIGGLLATIIASKKHRTGFATFSGILVALNVFLAIYTSSWDFWPFGWILFLISILMQKKVSKEQTIIINNMSPPQDSMTDARAKNIVQSCNIKSVKDAEKRCIWEINIAQTAGQKVLSLMLATELRS